MNLKSINPRQALNSAFLRSKPNRQDIDSFKENLMHLIGEIDDSKDEEYHKTEVRDFLRKTYYQEKFYFNVKDRIDYAICNGPKSSDSVGVIIETKKPTNKSEMITCENINAKALHELILYYLRERITQKNLEIKHLVVTNIHEWFIFDSSTFEKLFAQNKSLVKQFEDFEAKVLSGSSTDFFYNEIAKPFVNSLDKEIEFTYFNIHKFEKILKSGKSKGDTQLIPLFKLLSPEHLLKLPFANDSNSLDKKFYAELLHIIGLKETKEGGKKVIGRKPKGERDSGSLLENAILQLDSLDKISRLDRPSQYGETVDDRLFGVGLELCITWINRILFLKLLEAQLLSYHNGDKSYSFLNSDRIKNFDDLNALFFQVLAKKQEERNDHVSEKFHLVPYLNSSLFEPTDMEQGCFTISQLDNNAKLKIPAQTVLKESGGKKKSGEFNTLEYIFAFLDAYDFSSEGAEDIQEDNKTLINASVLGLIFEKINGYKDGSFFTPGFVTMYMCRETIRRAVVQKFNETKGWLCKSLDDLYNKIDDLKEANEIVNSLKICDPAVGSGHFLVSALNEIIAIKNDLNILQDRKGRRLKEYQVEVVNDELIITDEDGELFEYHHSNPESQRVQETLFHEKQTIIENCLFGVDINPNSVKICRLRLWIELLKNAYYKHTPSPSQEESEGASPVCYADAPDVQEGFKNLPQLETLPNIDINIKCGNSLISRFDLDSDMKDALKKSKWTIDSYKVAVDTYRNASSKQEKKEMERLMEEIKGDFRVEIGKSDPKRKRLRSHEGDLFNLTRQTQMFGMTDKQKKEFDKSVAFHNKQIEKLKSEIQEAENAKIYDQAFEWRFEFPEVLNDEGDFVGFDVVIGNPPYIRQEEFKEIKPYLQSKFETFAGTADLFVYFIELGIHNLKQGGEFVYIVPNKWMKAGYGLKIRQFIKSHHINAILDFGDLTVFDEATTYPCILSINKSEAQPKFPAANIDTLHYPHGLAAHVKEKNLEVLTEELSDHGWTLTDSSIQKLLAKIKSKGKALGEYVDGKIFYGIKTGLNEAFVIDGETRDQLIAEDLKSEQLIKPFLAGRDIKRYQQPMSDRFLILIKNGETREWFGELDETQAWGMLASKYSAIANYLIQFKEKAKARYDKGQYWWELRACDY